MQVKMAATQCICLGFLVLVLCLSHGSWSGSARSMLSESKRELSEESNQATNEPAPPENLSDPGSIKDDSNAPLEVVQGSESPISLGDSDQSACGWSPRGNPNCRPNNCHSHGCAITPRPYCGYPNHGCVYYPPQTSPECQPSSYPCPSYPECQPSSGPCPSLYPPQPNPDCYAPYPGCHSPSSQTPIPYPGPSCAPASSPYPGSGYEPHPTPGCYNPGCSNPNPNPNPGCAFPGCAYPPTGYAPQPNPGCLNPGPECVYPPHWVPEYPPQPNPGCLTPECQPNSGSAYPPQPNPWCASPGCLNYPPQIDPENPALPLPFYPPQEDSSHSSPGTGPRLNEENSLKQENNGSMPSNEVETLADDKVEEDAHMNEQDGSHHVTTPSTS